MIFKGKPPPLIALADSVKPDLRTIPPFKEVKESETANY